MNKFLNVYKSNFLAYLFSRSKFFSSFQVGSRIRCLHLFTLAGFAVAQPLYDLFAKNPDFFIARHTKAGEVVLFALAVSAFAPLLLFGLAAATRFLGRTASNVVFVVLLLILATLIALPLLKQITAPASIIVGASLLVSCAGVFLYCHHEAARQFVTLLSPAILIFPLLFLFTSPMRDFILPPTSYQAGGVALHDKGGAPPSIVMVLLDEFPLTSLLNGKHEIEEKCFPNFSILADDAHWFRNTISVADDTLMAIPAILTGNYPRAGLTASSTDHPQNLFTLLEGAYELNATESVTELCPERLCPDDADGDAWMSRYQTLLSDLGAVYLHLIAPRQYRDCLPSIENQWKDFRWRDARTLDNKALHQRALQEIKEDRESKFSRFVASINRKDKPALHFVHAMLPHAPFVRLPSGKIYTLPRRQREQGLDRDRWVDNQELVSQSYQRHLLQLAFLDAQIGKLVARLKKLGMYDSSLFVLTADHGVSFHPKKARRGLTPDNYEDIALVPFFMKLPNQRRGKVSDRRVETIDILPSIVDIVGIEPSQRMDGCSLFGPDIPGLAARRVFFEHAERSLVIDEKEFEIRKRAALRRKKALLDDDEHSLYAFGSVSVLARPLREFEILDSMPFRVELDKAFLFDDVDPSAPFFPAYISGRIYGAKEVLQRDRIAVAVNDTLWATMLPHDVDETGVRFSVIVPERAFVEGANDVRVFLARDHGQGRTILVPVADSGDRYRLVHSVNGQAKLVGADGTAIRIEGDALRGWLDGVHSRGPLVQFHGWAADVDNGQPARRVVMFKNGAFLYDDNPAIARDDVIQSFGDDNLRLSGFNITLPASLFGDDTDTVRIFAISENGRASELRYFKDFKWKYKS